MVLCMGSGSVIAPGSFFTFVRVPLLSFYVRVGPLLCFGCLSVVSNV